MAAVRAPSDAYLPHGVVTQLLRAALLDGEPAARAWREGRGALDRPEVDRPPAATWLRPLLGASLDRLGIEDPLLPELHAARQAAGAANEKLFGHIAALVGLLEREGMAVMVLKGAALGGGSDADPSLRPMSDVDVLVHPHQATRALDLARDAGWVARHAVDANFLAVKHAAHFADADGCQLDLHWFVFEECARPDLDDGFWRRSVEADFRGTAARRLGPADALLHACVHGARWTRTPGIRWVTDAWRIMDRGDVAWETLLAEAQRRSFIVRLRRPLRYLRGALGAPVPQWVEQSLAEMRPGLMERLEHAALGHEQRRLGALPSYVFAFNRAREADGPLAVLDFPAYLASAWGADSAADLIRAAGRRTVDRLSGAAQLNR
ncbi:MAG TPA: nucleotidyltransferase family protein [Candidatus Limnocylindrales bacterium]|nr:nucleotidyltransferase family protein [Candidatus Limnocylindrales bacterium]